MRLVLPILFLFTWLTGAAYGQIAAETVHRFGPGPFRPTAPLIPGADGALYGVTEGDKSDPSARVFRFTTTGHIEPLGTIRDYSYGAGSGSGLLSRDTLGNVWGTTAQGGFYNNGFVFYVTPTGKLRSRAMGDDVGQVVGQLLSGGNANMYGVARQRHTGAWAVFRVSSYSSSYEWYFNFAKVADLTLNQPKLLLTTRANVMIGTAKADDGGIDYFRLASDGKTTIFAHGTADMGFPVCLVEGKDQTLYGFSADGGATGYGTFFRIVPGLDAERLYDFTARPAGTLCVGGDSKFYGVLAGDAQTSATAFRLASDGTFEALGSLPGGGASGVAATDNGFYGTVAQGGDHALGAIVRFDANGSVNTAASFKPYGISPGRALTADASGNVYGVTSESGPDFKNGLIYKISANGVFTPLGSLPSAVGSMPGGGIAIGPDGTIFGTTTEGGAHGFGTAFRLDTNGQFTSLGSFNASTGTGSRNPLCFASDGKVYGSCNEGGAHGNGTIYQVDVRGGIVKLADLGDAIGYGPRGRLVEAPDHALYGIAEYGGPGSAGTIFRVTTQGQVTVAADFQSDRFSGYPSGQMVLGSDGAFYGFTGSGFFRWPLTGSPAMTNAPENLDSGGGLALGNDGYLYGADSNSNSDALDIYRVSFPSWKISNAAITAKTVHYADAAHVVSASDGRLYGLQLADGGFIYRVPIGNSHAPITQSDRFSVRPGPQNLSVLANDTDEEGDELTITAVVGAMQGDVTINPDQTLSYTAHAGFSGTDTFTYEIADGYGGKASATVDVFNTPPVAPTTNAYTRVAYRSKPVDLLPATSDPDEGQTLTVVSVSAPAHGTAAIVDGRVVYTPGKDFRGDDSFTYTVSDGFGGSTTGLMHVSDAPFLAAGNYGGTTRRTFGPNSSGYLIGPIHVTVSRGGAFTAKLGWTFRVQGTFGADGHFRRVIKSSGERYVLELKLDAATQTITGRAIDKFGLVERFGAARQIYSARNNSPQAGRYTFVIWNGEVFSYRDRDEYHFGPGYGMMHVSEAGRVKLTGRLGDGAAWSAGTVIYGADQCSFRARIPYPGYSSGDLAAAIKFNDLTSSDASGEFTWSRLILRPLGHLSLNQPGYSVDSSFVASRFVRGTPLLRLSGETRNARVTYEGGPFVDPVEQTLSWSAANIVTRADSGGPRLNLQLNGNTGLFQGSFRPTQGNLTSFRGVVLQKANYAGGLFRHGHKFGSVILEPTP